MKIGHYVSVVAGQKGFERNVSGHIQTPLYAMRLLADAGHECHLITNKYDESTRTLPFCYPRGCPMHTVDDACDRGGVLERTSAAGSGVSLLGALRQVRQIKQIARQERFDVVHFYGFARTAQFAGVSRLLRLPCPAVVTLFGEHGERRFPLGTGKLIWRAIDERLTATDFVKSYYAQMGVGVRILRHGIIRDLTEEFPDTPLPKRNRVLFWRDLSETNGADIARDVYAKLAPKYPHINFDFAIRPFWEEISGVDELANQHANIHVYRFPYPEGVTLGGLIAGSVCVLLPMRVLSIDPQLVIAESLAAGIPVVASDYRSNPELVKHGQTGMLTPPGDVDATTAAVEELIRDPQRAQKMGERAAEDIRARWNWDNYTDECTQVYRDVISGR